MSIPTTPRQPWMRDTDRWTWIGTKHRFSGPTKPKWTGGYWWNYALVEEGPEGVLSTEAERRASMRRIAPARKARRAKGKAKALSPWIECAKRFPPCSRSREAEGVEVLVHPRGDYPFAYYGRRCTDRPLFYLHGAALHPQPTHWMPIPVFPDGEFPAPRAPKGRGR